MSNAQLQDLFYESAKDNDADSEKVKDKVVRRGLLGEA